MTMFENTLIEAINSRRLISFSYESQPIRRAASHAIYISTAGNKLLDAYQFEGYSKTGNLPDWRNFNLSKMENLVVFNEKFEIAPGYKPFSSKYSRRVLVGSSKNLWRLASRCIKMGTNISIEGAPNGTFQFF